MIIGNVCGGIEVPMLMADGWSKTLERVYLFSSIYSIKIYWYCENNIIQFIYICFSHYSKLCICNRRFWEVARSFLHEIAFSTYLFYYSTGSKWFLVESVRARPLLWLGGGVKCESNIIYRRVRLVRRWVIYAKLLIRMELGLTLCSVLLLLVAIWSCIICSFGDWICFN